MKKLSTFLFLIFISQISFSQSGTFCHPTGNIIIYSNYDGGSLNINVDQNIPNLKIGIVTYEKCEITLSGTYVNNVSQIWYAGYNGNNDHCSPSLVTTVINGAPAGTDSIILIPTSTWSNANGYQFIICNYSCDSATSQGGCNTPDQIVHYFITQFGGSLYYHFTQYGCWSGTKNVSDVGNCCIGANLIEPTYDIQAGFTMVNDTICSKDTFQYNNISTSTYPGGTHYSWNFGDGSPLDTSVSPLHSYNLTGTFTITLIATDSTNTASDTFQMQVTVIQCGGTGIYEFANYKFNIYPNPIEGKLFVNASLPDKTEIIISDITGRIIQSQYSVDGSKTLLDVSDLDPGIYFISFQTSEGKVIRKFIRL